MTVAPISVISTVVAPSIIGVVLLTAAGVALARVAVVDLAEQRIPNAITHPAVCVCLGVGVGGVALGAVLPATAASVGALLFATALLVPHVWNAQLMGRGDVKLAVPLGFGIGWVQSDVHAVVTAISWTIVAACAIGLAMGAAANRGRSLHGTAVPFGPALSVAGWGAVALTLAQR